MVEVEAAVATLTEQVAGLRDDMANQFAEMQRTRERLHTLETTATTLILTNQQRERERAQRDKIITRWMQLLTIIIGLAGVVTPLAYSGITH